jgi:glycosyltransferase involved in cell wall biosynthesis
MLMAVAQNLMVVIPALNEAATIGEVVTRALAAAGGVIVVDDGSTDGTGEISRCAGAHVIRHEAPGGYDAAISEGLNAAFGQNSIAVVTMDADGQHRIEDMIRVSTPVVSGEVAFCAGVRSRFNRPIEALIGLMSAVVFGTKDPFCGLKCYHRKLYETHGPFPPSLNIQTLPLAWVRKDRLQHRFEPIIVKPRMDQPRFGPMLRASVRLLLAFFRTLGIFLKS